ncbi:MAG: hypothetical protein HY748_09625 [Elusimicrobia bacterium]|nr:hypothetical protein [Elusimicrobiota bacterium]
MRTIFLAALSLACASWGAIGYTRYAQPKGDYVIEYPSDWRRSYGMQTVWLEPPGASSKVKVGLELHPYGKEAALPEGYIAELMEKVDVVKKLDSRGEAEVAGRKAEKLAFTEVIEHKGRFGEKLPGPLREIHYVVPFSGKWFYVLKIQGIGETYDRALPEFERLAQKLELKGPPDAAKSQPKQKAKPKK